MNIEPHRDDQSQHPKWCSPAQCVRRPNGAIAHRSDPIIVAQGGDGDGLYIKLFLELGHFPPHPFLIMERYSALDPEPFEVLGFRPDPARATVLAMTSLLGEIGIVP